MLEQVPRQVEFLRLQLDALAVPEDFAAGPVQRESPGLDAQHLLGRRLRAPHDRGDAGGQHGRRRRLDDVVVGAGGQGLDHALVVIEAAEDDDRGASAHGAVEPADQGDALGVRQGPVEQEEVVPTFADLAHESQAAFVPLDVVPLAAQRLDNALALEAVVLDQRDAEAGGEGVQRSLRGAGIGTGRRRRAAGGR